MTRFSALLLGLVFLPVWTSSSALALGFKSKKIGSVAIVSDVDDTVRPTGTLHLVRAAAVALGLKKVKALAGMPELYQALLDHAKVARDSGEIFVSGAPVEISEDLRPWLHDNGFSILNVHTNTKFPIEGVGPYKEGDFRKIMIKSPKTRFYFFGDDTQKDPESIATTLMLSPSRLLGLYIHRIEDRIQARAGEIPYFTAVDVALRELKKKTLSSEQVEGVAQAVIDADFNEEVVPSYAKLCPPAGWLDELVTELQLTESGGLTERLSGLVKTVEAHAALICTPNRKPTDDLLSE